MRIVHWDEMFHPDFGYQINVLTKYQAMQGHEIIIVTSEKIQNHPTFRGFATHSSDEEIVKGDKNFEKMTGVKIIRLPIRKVVSGRVIYKRGYIKILEQLKPDVLFCHTHDTFSGMKITRYAKNAQFPIVFDSHMLEMASINPLKNLYRIYYKTFYTPIIKKNKYVIIRTQNDAYVEKCLGIPLEQAPFISFGTDTSLFFPNEKVKLQFREDHNISPDDFVIVYTGKLSQAKGGKLLAQALKKKLDNNKNKKVVALIIGTTDGDYGVEVESLLEESENTIIRFSTQKYFNLAKFYQAADLCVFAKQCSLSFYDAQACGVPVLSEDNDVNRDRMKYKNGLNFIPDDVEDFRRKIIEFIEMPIESYNEMRDNSYLSVKNNYNYKKIAQEYTDIIKEEYDKFYKREK